MKLENLPFKIVEVDASHDWLPGHGYITAIDRCGFFLCTSGKLRMQMGDSQFVLSSGGIMIYTPSSLMKVVDQSDDVAGMWMEVTTDFILQYLTSAMDVSKVFSIRFNPLVELTDADAADRVRQMRVAKEAMLMDVVPDRSRIALEIIKCRVLVLVYEILDRFFQQHPEDPLPRGLHNQVLQTFVVHLFRYYRTNREVAFYAKLQNMTPRYFSSVIKAMSGNTASTWINNLVVAQMRQMLNDPSLSIKEVAANFNFPSQSFFGKYFKLHTGLSPKDYRRTLE